MKLNIIYNIITCNPEPQADGPEWCPVCEWIFFFWTVPFSEVVEPVHQIGLNVWNGSSSTDLQVDQIKTHFQMPDSHSDWKWASMPACSIWSYHKLSHQRFSSSNRHWTEENVCNYDWGKSWEIIEINTFI